MNNEYGKYMSMLSSIKSDTNSTDNMFMLPRDGDRVVLIDAFNLFFRNFATMNAVNSSLQHIGGLEGFLRSLGSIVNTLGATKVYVVFEGQSSSANRKNLISEYKSNRGVKRLTNHSIYTSLEDENEGKIQQMTRLMHYLECLPVHCISIDKTEADDVISHIAIRNKTKNIDTIICSTDKDYLQLISNNIRVYSPIKKILYDREKVIEEFSILPENFILYKSICGDSSDNISGISGVQIKTLLKMFPELTTTKLTLNDIYTMCSNRFLSKGKIGEYYSKIVMFKNQVETNYKVMNLFSPMIHEIDCMMLDEYIDTNEVKLLVNEFMELYKDDGLGSIITSPRVWLDEHFKDLK